MEQFGLSKKLSDVKLVLLKGLSTKSDMSPVMVHILNETVGEELLDQLSAGTVDLGRAVIKSKTGEVLKRFDFAAATWR